MLFFSLNGAVATWTALSGDLALWGFYNGFLAYLLIGVCFGVERIIRHFVRKSESSVRECSVHQCSERECSEHERSVRECSERERSAADNKTSA